MATYLITGASRGIGLEFARQALESNTNNKVIATARNPAGSLELQNFLQKHKERLTLLPLNVDDENSIKGLRARLEVTHPKGIDYLINNAGISGKIVSDKDDLLATFTTHVLGPWMLIHELLPLVQRSTKKVIVGISSLAGCLTYQKSSGEFYSTHFKGDFAGYRISKTAQNCLFTTFAHDPRYKDVIFVTTHPGAVATDMIANVGASHLAELTPEQSVIAQLKIFEGLKPEDTGKYYNYTGDVLPW